jgi:hypothetical protein
MQKQNEQEDLKPLTHDMECVRCEHVLDCKGNPRHVARCLNFKERKRHGRS